MNPLIDSKEIIKKGVEFHDAAKYKEAIVEYLKVPASDTSYSSVLHELILSYYNDSNYVEAEKYAGIALELFPDQYAEWYGLLSDLYDDSERPDLALRAYDTILAQNPYNYRTHFNKGIFYFRQMKYEEATACFQRCILINPYYSSAHYFLGKLCLLKGNMVEAMMSFATNLLVSPGNNYKNNSINYMVTISEVNTTATELLEKYKPGKEDNFEEVQDILLSKAALDKKYKLKAELEDPIVRQLQVMMEKLEYNANDKGFWMQYYVPLFTSLWENKQFEPLVFYVFSELEIKKVKEYNNKEKKRIEEFSGIVRNYLGAVRETQELMVDKRATAKTRYYIKDYKVNGKGAYSKNAKDKDVLTGPWEFYNENNLIRSKGNFDAEEMRQGEWRFYHENGGLNEITSYNKDLANGKSVGWFDNGLPSRESNYIDDKLEGAETVYFYNGRLKSVINYKAGKKEGIAKYYNIDGYLRTVANYKNDLQEGEETVYHANGKLYYTVKYEGDLTNGEYKEYFDNGKLKTTGFYAGDKKTGTWKSYFIDDKMQQVESYIGGELVGELLSYYPNGKMESKSFYKKGEIDGLKQDFDDDGIIYRETIFENDRLRDMKFFDKKGNVISSVTSRRGNADVTFYNADGIKTSQGHYSKDGLAEGKFTYFYKNGTVSGEDFYKNGLQEGKKIFYHPDGKVSQEGNYTADKANGYYTSYYRNGQVSDEGWYVDDERQGTFINYNLLGNITSKIYYLNGNKHGISEYYTPTGKLDFNEYYDHGWLNKTNQYDSTGKLIVRSVLNKGEGKIRFNLFNGKPYVESNYKDYRLHGVYTSGNGDGSKRVSSYYKNGVADSTYTCWFPNGKISVQGKYVNGDKAGEWKYFYYSGQLSEIENYVDGKLHGTCIQYNEDGKLDKRITFKNGMNDGETIVYGDKDQVMLVYFYKDDELKGYSYEDKTGKLVAMIPLIAGAGTLESYYRNGVKSAHMTFIEGKAAGERLMYFSNGKVYISGTRLNGLEHGIKKVYYPSGKLMEEENYYYGERHGSFKYFNEDGTLISDMYFYLGSMHGDCKYYTAGKPVTTYVYYFGEMQSKK